MRRNKLKNFLHQNLQGWGMSLLISVCLAGALLVSLSVLKGASYEDVGARECPTDDIVYTLNLISPSQLGVKQWQIGDYAEYQYNQKSATVSSLLEQHFKSDAMQARLSSRDVKFHIIGELSTSGQSRYWMRKTGLAFFRAIPKDIYRLVSPADLRITSETPRFHFVRNYVPRRDDFCQQVSTPLATLVKLEESETKTPAGLFNCIHYRVEFGTNSAPIEIWVDPKIRPLGIVRVSTPNEVLELASYGQDTAFDVPELIHPVIEGVTTLAQGCTSCHGYDNCHELISPPR